MALREGRINGINRVFVEYVLMSLASQIGFMQNEKTFRHSFKLDAFLSSRADYEHRRRSPSGAGKLWPAGPSQGSLPVFEQSMSRKRFSPFYMVGKKVKKNNIL